MVFIHGLCGKKELWVSQLERFSPNYETVAIDLLGHGQSSPVEARRLVSSSTARITSLLAGLPPLPTVFIGHSLGGWIVNELLRSTSTVAAAVFVDSSCMYAPATIQDYHDWGAAIRESADPRKMIGDWFGRFLTDRCASDIRRQVVDETLRFDPAWIADLMSSVEACKPVDWTGPTLVMEGEQYFPAGNELSWLHHFPRARHWRHQAKGHFFFMEETELFNSELERFLQDHPLA